mgnify:CR=1 FL=1
MARYNKRIVKRICDLIRKDSYTIAEICASVRISERCYYYWQNNVAEFAEAIKEARDQYDEILVKEAKNSLLKLVKGYEVDEKKTVYVNGKDGKPIIKEQTTVKKHIQPNVAATIFMLTNKAPDEYKNKQFSELTGKDGKDLVPPAKLLTKKEAKELLKELEDEC